MLAITALYFTARHLATRRRSRERIFEEAEAETAAHASVDEHSSWLAQWLFRAGFRSPAALTGFLAWSGAAFTLGALLTAFVYVSGVTERASQALASLPGGLADIAVPVITVAPWTLLVLGSSLPTVAV